MVSVTPPAASDVGAAAAGVLAALLDARTGQHLAVSRAWRIDTALRPLVTERGLESIDQLVTHLLGGSDPALGDRIVDALLNQETSFFRDPGVIEAAVAAARATGAARPHVWSAGCATGQEALSLAMAFAETGEPADIVATDVSASAVARARAGRYTQFEIQRGLPIRRLLRWFTQDDAEWIAAPELLRLVRFRRHNLVADPPPGAGFDVILCRNVLYYLAPARRTAVLDRFAAALRPGGVLILGAGETVIGQSERFIPSQRFRGAYECAALAHDPVARLAG